MSDLGSMGASASRVPLIYLYVPISVAREYRPVVRSPLGRAKAGLLRVRDRLGWTLLRSNAFDCVVIGNGLRTPPAQLLLFERILNLVHELVKRRDVCRCIFWGRRRRC